MPFLNKVIEQKKNNELELEKKNNEIKKIMSLLEMAKKSKAEQIVNLNRQLQNNSMKISQMENEIKENRIVI